MTPTTRIDDGKPPTPFVRLIGAIEAFLPEESSRLLKPAALTKVIQRALAAGVAVVAEQLGSGQLRVFRTLADWLAAYRQYRRDEAGRLLDAGSDLIKATALLALYGRDVAVTENVAVNGTGRQHDDYDSSGRCPITGY